MSSTIKIPAMPEPVGYTDRSWLESKGGGQFSRRSFPGLQLPLHTAEQLAARDAQWQEMVGPVVEALQAMLDRDELNTCQHSNTHRGGVIWTICDDCNAKWADDEGGKPKWKDPKEWIAACAALSAITEE